MVLSQLVLFTRHLLLQRRLPAVAEYRGRVQVLGGSFLTSWSAVSCDGSWTQQRPQPRLGRAAAQAVVLGDKLYLLGGQTLDHKVGRG